jgi:hypothetical protein
VVAVYALATCTASILRGTSANTWGDVTDNATVAASGIPAAITVKSRTVSDSATQTSRVIETVTGAVGSNLDIRDTDRLRDDTHGITYSIEAVTQPGGTGLTADLQLELRRVR